MENLKITIVQTSLVWEDAEANLEHFSDKLKKIASGETDLIILPEMFTTGFSIHREKIAEEPSGKGFKWMQRIADEKNCVITGSIAVKENGKLYNRLYWVKPGGDFHTYDKRHLFRMAGENEHFTAGTKKLITELKGWKICPLICYDLRFPVWSRNTWKKEKADYDLLIYVANWPAVRSYPWKQLLIARAIENQAYVAGVNRIGEDGNNFAHSGDSAVIGPRGELFTDDLKNEDVIITTELNASLLLEFRKNFPAGMDADQFYLT